MTQEPPWPAAMTQAIGAQVRKYRKEAGLTAAQLAERMAKVMSPPGGTATYTRAMVTNLEANRRTTITVSEVIAFAAVLGLAPAALITFGSDTAALMPGVTVDPWRAYRWFCGTGEQALFNSINDENFGAPHPDLEAQLSAFFQHDTAALQYAHARIDLRHRDPEQADAAREHQASKLAVLIARRDVIKARGWSPPPLPEGVAKDVAQVEAER